MTNAPRTIHDSVYDEIEGRIRSLVEIEGCRGSGQLDQAVPKVGRCDWVSVCGRWVSTNLSASGGHELVGR